MAYTLLLTGTCGTAWHGLAKLLAPASIDHGKSAALPVGAGPFFLSQPTTAISQLLVAHRDLQVAAFCEPPAAFLASKAAELGQISFEDALQAWCKDAEALLSFWRKNRSRFHLLNWTECSAFPENFSAWISQFASQPLEWHWEKQPSKAGDFDDLHHLVCQSFVREQPKVERLWREIQAACEPLATCFKAEAPLSGAFEAYQNLVQARAAHAGLLVERDALDARCLTLAAERAAISARLSALHAEHQQFATRNQALIVERDELATRNQALAVERNALAADFATRNQALIIERDELATRNQALAVERNALAADFQKQKEQALQTHEMLLKEIHSAHLESEGFFEEWKSLEAATSYHYLQLGATIRGQEQISPTHSHLNFSFECLELLERSWPRLAVRLVQHNGNAGLAVFDIPAEKNRPLFHWKPAGEEGGIDYMLFVPTDKSASEILVALPATDLILLRCLTARILGHLAVHGETPSGRWAGVARRLLQQIEEIPERLHYDSITVVPVQKGSGKGLHLTASHLYYRGSVVERFCWTWNPESRGGEIVLHKNEIASALFLNWPFEKEIFRIGFENSEELEDTKSFWSQLLERDREFLRLLVAALPDFIFHFCEQHPECAMAKHDLTKKAKILCRKLDEFSRTKFRRSLFSRIFAP